MANKIVNRVVNIGWTDVMRSQFTGNPRVIRRLLTTRDVLHLIEAWHKYGSRADKRSPSKAKALADAPGVTPTGRLCLEAAHQAMRGFTFATFLTQAKKMVSGPQATRKNAS